MSIPFEEFEQSNSRTCQVTASAVDASRFLLAENQTPKAQNPRFLSKPGVLSTSNLAVKESAKSISIYSHDNSITLYFIGILRLSSSQDIHQRSSRS